MKLHLPYFYPEPHLMKIAIAYLGVKPLADDVCNKGVINSVNRKCPKWFVPNCISNPSFVFAVGIP